MLSFLFLFFYSYEVSNKKERKQVIRLLPHSSRPLTHLLSCNVVACVAGVIGEGEGERGRREKNEGD